MTNFYKYLPRVYLPPPKDTSALTYSGSSRRVLGGCYSTFSTCGKKVQSENNRVLSTTDTSDGTIFYLIYGNQFSGTTDTFYETVALKMNAYDSTALTKDLTFISQINIFLNINTGFPLIASVQYLNQIGSTSPGFPNFPVVKLESGERWIALVSITLQDDGYVFGIADKTGQQAPNTIQIKNNLTYNDSKASNSQMIQISDSKEGILNITGLENYTTYNIYFFATNNDLSSLASSSIIRVLSGTTAMEDPVDDSYGHTLKIHLTALLIANILFFFM